MTNIAPTADDRALEPVRGRHPIAGRAERALGGLRFRPFLTVLGMVVILAGFYYALMATPLYVSSSQFAIRSGSGAVSGAGAGESGAGALRNLVSGGGGAALMMTEITAVSQYIHSQDMLSELERRHGLRARYTGDRLDPFRRLDPNASAEDFLTFYRKMVTVQINREAAIITVRVRDFNPKDAQAVNQSILQLTERYVDGLSSRLRRESLSSAEQDLLLAQQQVQQARSAVAAFRSTGDDVDPAQTGSSTVGGVASLEQQAAGVRGELNALRTYARPNTPQVRQLEARLATINAQIATLQARQGPTAGGGSLSQRVTQYEALLAQRTFAEEKLTAAQTAYDRARTTVRDQEKYVVPVVRANLPDESTEPRRLSDFLMVVLFAAAAYAIVTLAIAGIRDHQGV